MSAIANLPGYQITEKLYTGTRTLVYRGIRTNNQQPVAIKLLRNEYPNFHELVQFRNQYTIAKNLDYPSIIKPLSLEEYGNSYALIMEDFGGISLSNYLQTAINDNPQYKYLPLLEFLEIAIKLTETLQYLYQNRIIHKDIKPANILINPDSKQVKLIDFSIASLLARETQEIQNTNDLEGTLAYLSPEQTGRMNRGIDYRSDFYSLGITFYELLTGALPFASEDAMELVHCHLAKQPIPVHKVNPEITLVLSEIVSKLMAKNAEGRYQSALGIKHDLEKCLTQLKQRHKIDYFEIGKRDISDRFLIPEKLYGRETEVSQLLNSFERVANGTTEMMLVAGFSGIGKTAVVNEVHKPIVRQRGYFIKGKYDQFQRNIPFSALLQAFRDLMGQILSESDRQLQTWKSNILEALGDNGQILIEVIPELENIIGKQPPAIELSGIAAQNRFNLVFSKFMQVFTSFEHPLVMFLDDLQWADSASLNLLKLLMQDSGYLLILGAYRDNEVSPVHPFILTVDEIVKTGATVNTITLPPLTQSDLNQLVADTLNCELSLAQPLTKLVYQKTQGNPFFATQFLKALHDEKLITFNWDIQHWQCDIAQVEALAITDNVVEFMASQLQKLPITTQEVLKLAACIGAQFDLHTLAIVSQQLETETATVLWRALQEGLILPITNVYKFYQLEGNNNLSSEHKKVNQRNARYRFLHDRIQQAAYSLIPDEQKQVTHLKIGQLMLEKTPQSTLKEKIFDIVNHLNIGSELICDPTQREQLATLNLMAGQKAKLATAYADAVRYLNVSLALLEAEKWQSKYDLMLSVHIEAAEAEYLNTNFQKLASLAQIVLEKAKTVLDEMKIYELQIQAYQLQSIMLKAIDTGLEALEKLGIFLSANICDRPMPDLPKIEDLDSIPEMNDRHQLTALRIMMALYPPIYIAKPEMIGPLILTMVQLCIEGGHSPLAAYSYVLYGIILCAEKGRIEQGYHAGQLALKLLDKFHATELKAKIYVLFNAHIRFWKEPAQLTLNAYLEGYQSGLETGDIEWASYSCMHYCQNLFITGKYLELVEKEQASYQSVIVKNNHEFALYYARIWMQITLNLQGKATDNLKLIGNDFDESLLITQWQSNNNYMSLFALYLAKANLAYLFEDVTAALDYALIAREYIGASIGLITIGVYNFYLSLILLAAYPQVDTSKQKQYLSDVKENQKNLSEWFTHAPQNFHHKYLLVEAEKARVLGKKLKAVDLYDRAISLAKENEYIQEEALANELAAKFYLDWGKEKVAAGYMQEAYYCYARWGAKAKVTYLEQHYPQLLRAILQHTNFAIGSGGTISKTILRSSSSSLNQNLWLDFKVVMKAAQAISQEIELEKLLATLMQTAIASAGAQTGILVIRQEAEWLVVAKANQTYTENLQIPLAECQELPKNLIYSVARNQKTAVFDRLSLSEQLMSDRYIMTHQPKSVLCTPISNQGKLIAILYLENNLTEGAFTSDRVETLQILSSQAAISIENARLYQQVENYSQTLETEVERKTEELSQKATDLEQALQNLQHTQAQLIQSEKMSALGQLVAGIAHEINNPVTFIHSNLHPTKNYVQDLLSLLELYQQEYPQANSVIQEKIEDIDLEFIREDLIKSLQSMKVGSERIKQIILSLQNFSRLNESDMKPVDLHSGIDSTLLLLQNRFQENNNKPRIQVIKEYGNLPLISCYASEMNQVFLSIITNALDALKEVRKTNKNPFIKIQTEVREKECVRIAIADNGIGIPAHIQKRIFEPFFTTKPVGSGTGLGLSVSYAIVKKHGGQLTCDSTVGSGTKFVIEIPVG
ncbi:AAA family ATPase [Phormidium sp. LEGE 05292]|uniref:trifunctional serine/threonine-protein kinase/ATP-binding protein/sensor histidine kinase n=1 Tax=[Phormidium] sp. LEGE 05292 TaxID=767427 RepID=UPI00187F8B0E|nr:ATP-binding sensor histidine kinase [Phormidium sp. LEGE 05292]MBE9227632.1 AAA family ATPase [Phormidium sp. LEGE 05292]